MNQYFPQSLYNCSPEECTPRTPVGLFLKNWAESIGFKSSYPAVAVAQEMTYEHKGCMSRAIMGKVLRRSVVCNSFEELQEAMLSLFHEFRAHHGRVYIYPRKQDEPDLKN